MGLVVEMGNHVIYFATRFQKYVAFSSGEAELSAQIARVSEGIGVQNLRGESLQLVRIQCGSDEFYNAQAQDE